jgi:hypothetical protein
MCQDGRQHVRQGLRNTDAYMDLFVDELNHAYVSGAWMWDAHLKETFLFKAKLFATVCDWPGCQTRNHVPRNSTTRCRTLLAAWFHASRQRAGLFPLRNAWQIRARTASDGATDQH